MFIVKNTVAAKRMSRVIQHPYLVGMGKIEYTILMKLLSDKELTELEEERADRMQTTLSQLSHITKTGEDSNLDNIVETTDEI